MNVAELKAALATAKDDNMIVFLRVTHMEGTVSFSELHECAAQETETGSGEFAFCLDGLDEGDEEEDETEKNADGETDEEN